MSQNLVGMWEPSHTVPTPRARVLLFAATHGSGVATHVTTLARGLDSKKYDVRVLCPDQGDLHRRLQSLGVAVDTLPMDLKVSLRDMTFVARLARYLRARRFDILHCHSTKAGFWGRIIGAACGVPIVIYTPNAYRFLRYRKWSPSWVLYVAVEWVSGRLGALTIASSASEGEFTRTLHLVAKGACCVVNNGVALPGYGWVPDPQVRRRLGLSVDSRLVVTVGRLDDQKRPLVFVEAAAIVARRHPNVTFVMVGEGELESVVRRRIDSCGLQGIVRLIPRVDDVFSLLFEADVFVMTSAYEGLCYSAAEAGIAGRSLVLSDVPGLRELMPQELSTLLVRGGDSDQFAATICTLLQDPQARAATGKRIAAFISQQFSIDQMLRGTEGTYDRLLAGRGAFR